MIDVGNMRRTLERDNYLELFIKSIKDFMSIPRGEVGDLFEVADKEKLENIRLTIGSELLKKMNISHSEYEPNKRRSHKLIATDIHDLARLMEFDYVPVQDFNKLFSKTRSQLEDSDAKEQFEKLLEPLRKEIDVLKRRCKNLENENSNIKNKYEELNAKVTDYKSNKNGAAVSGNYANVFKLASTPLKKRTSTAAEDPNDDVFSIASSKKFRSHNNKANTPRVSISSEMPKSLRANTLTSNKTTAKKLNKQKPRKQEGFRGQNQKKSEIAPKKYIHLFVGRVKSKCENEEVRRSINEFLTIEEFKQLATKSTRYKCFYLKVPFEQKAIAYDPTLWPNNVLVSRYYFPKKSRNDEKQIAQQDQTENASEANTEAEASEEMESEVLEVQNGDTTVVRVSN